MESATRPEVVLWRVDDPLRQKLHPGSSERAGRVEVEISSAVFIDKDWVSILAMLRVEDMALSSPRPAVVFMRKSDVPTLVHFPSLARPDDVTFGGWWTLALRVVE